MNGTLHLSKSISIKKVRKNENVYWGESHIPLYIGKILR